MELFFRDEAEEQLGDYSWGGWGDIPSDRRDEFEDESGIKECVDISEVLCKFKAYIEMNNKTKIVSQCPFCLSTPTSIQTLKEHYKNRCGSFRKLCEMASLSEAEQLELIFLLGFLAINMKNLCKKSLSFFSTLAFNDIYRKMLQALHEVRTNDCVRRLEYYSIKNASANTTKQIYKCMRTRSQTKGTKFINICNKIIN